MFPYLIIGTLVTLSAVIGIVSFYTGYQKKLFQQQEAMHLKESNYQKELIGAVIETQENERERISKDLHDEVGAMLSTTKLYMNELQENLDNPPYAIELLQQTQHMLDESVQTIRRISKNLIPSLLEKHGLAKALESFFERINQADSIQVEFSCQIDLSSFELSKQLALYRMAQELTNNTLKHAQAKSIQVALYFEEKNLILLYQDDGIGFEVAKAQEASGLGLKSMESRARVLGGTIVYQSKPQQGLKVLTTIPLQTVQKYAKN